MAFLATAGCASGNQSPNQPAGVQARRIDDLFWLFFGVCATAFVIVLAFIGAALVRRRVPQPVPAEPRLEEPEPEERRRVIWVVSAVAVTVTLLFVLLVGDFLTGRAVDALAEPEPLVIKVVAHQWWWEVDYEDPDPSKGVITANEIHIPVGRVVRFELESPDVIHSFWVPNLHGKKDMIPSHPTTITLRADAPGEYWGQCAEYCGYQHANMRFLVIAEPDEDFQKWLSAQRQPAHEPTTDGERRGRDVFLSSTCITCHTIQGTRSLARVGPDLTHVAGRRRIAAGTLPNTRGHLGGWVMDAQGIKPGVRMPLNPLRADELHPLLDYLQSLK